MADNWITLTNNEAKDIVKVKKCLELFKRNRWQNY